MAINDIVLTTYVISKSLGVGCVPVLEYQQPSLLGIDNLGNEYIIDLYSEKKEGPPIHSILYFNGEPINFWYDYNSDGTQTQSEIHPISDLSYCSEAKKEVM